MIKEGIYWTATSAIFVRRRDLDNNGKRFPFEEGQVTGCESAGNARVSLHFKHNMTTFRLSDTMFLADQLHAAILMTVSNTELA